MKRILILLLLIVSTTLGFSQTQSFSVQFTPVTVNNTSGNLYNITGEITDVNGVLNASDVAVGDSLHMIQEGVIYPLVLTVINSAAGTLLDATFRSVAPFVSASPSITVEGKCNLARKNINGYIAIAPGLPTPLAEILENRFKTQLGVETKEYNRQLVDIQGIVIPDIQADLDLKATQLGLDAEAAARIAGDALNLQKTDTVSLSNRINLKVNIADTAAMLLPYVKSSALVGDASLQLKAVLEGPYVTATGLMSQTLRSGGLIPLTQPYGNSVFKYYGSETTTSTVTAVSDASNGVVDWVLVEIRDVFNNIVQRKAALLQSDGDIVDVDGVTNTLVFKNIIFKDAYYVYIRHRNHKVIRTLTTVNFDKDVVKVLNTRDNVIADTKVVGTTVIVNAMRMGDVDQDGFVTTGADVDSVRSTGFNTFNVYRVGDVNMDKFQVVSDVSFVRNNAETVRGGVNVSIKAFLQGAYQNITNTAPNGSNLMRDDLRVAGLVPKKSPYDSLAGFTMLQGGAGDTLKGNGITTAQMINNTGSKAIIDWVFVEFRAKTNPSVPAYTRSALILADGSVVNSDSNTVFMNVPNGDYYIALRHRNHLGVMTANSFYLDNVQTTINFGDTLTGIWGAGGMFKTTDGKRCLWSGNTEQDGVINYDIAGQTDTSYISDRTKILRKIGGTNVLATVAGYAVEDVNMDGTTIYSSTNNDADIILQNVSSATSTNTEQIPNHADYYPQYLRFRGDTLSIGRSNTVVLTKNVSTSAITIGATTYPVETAYSSIDSALNVESTTNLNSKWSTAGNAGTTAGTNFIGTTDNTDLVFKRNGVEAGFIKNTDFHVFGQDNFNRTTSTGASNTAVGAQNFTVTTSGSNNTALGYGNFNSNLTGSNNTGIGLNNLYLFTAGSKNVAVGNENFRVVTSGSNGVAVGSENFWTAASVSTSTAVGYRNFYLATSLFRTTAVGHQNFFNTTTATLNTAVGVSNFSSNKTGGTNTGIGIQNFTSDTLSDRNTGVGYLNFNAILSGTNNTALGYGNFANATLGFNNTAVGYGNFQANSSAKSNNTGVGYENFYNTTTGSNNVGLGYQNFTINTTGSNNIAIGSSIVPATNALSNTVSIGNSVSVSSSDMVVLGGANITKVQFRGEAGYNYTHDVSNTLSAADEGKVWTYDNTTTSIKLKSVSSTSAITVGTTTYPIGTALSSIDDALNTNNNTDLIDLIAANGTSTSYGRTEFVTSVVNRTRKLPLATAANIGKSITYKHDGLTDNVMTVTRNTTDLIDGSSAFYQLTKGASVTFKVTSAGNVKVVSEYKPSFIVEFTPVDNGTTTPQMGTPYIKSINTSVVDAASIDFPSVPRDGQLFTLFVNGVSEGTVALTNLSWTNGSTYGTPPTTYKGGDVITWIYSSVEGVWRIYNLRSL